MDSVRLRRLPDPDSDSEEEAPPLRRRSNSDPQGIARALHGLRSGETEDPETERILSVEEEGEEGPSDGRLSRSRLRMSASTEGIVAAGEAVPPSRRHRKRALSHTLRRSKFWLRLLQPWKWKRRKPAASASFSVERSAPEETHEASAPPDLIPSSASFPPPSHSPGATASASGDLELNGDWVPEDEPRPPPPPPKPPSMPPMPVSCIKVTGATPPKPPPERTKGRMVVVVAPEEEPVTVIRASTVATSEVQRVFVGPVPPSPPQKPPPEDPPEERAFSRKAAVDSAMCSDDVRPPPPYPSSSAFNDSLPMNPADYTDSSEGSSPDRCSLMEHPNVEQIPAREPDLSAKPAKPALRNATAGAYARLKRPTPPRPDSYHSDTDSDDDVKYREQEAEELAARLDSALPTNGHAALPRLPDPPLIDEDEDMDEDAPVNSIAAKVFRKDTLALKDLLQEPSEEENGEVQSPREKMRQASIRLERRLSQRPTASELEQRDILRDEDDAQIRKAQVSRPTTHHDPITGG